MEVSIYIELPISYCYISRAHNYLIMLCLPWWLYFGCFLQLRFSIYTKKKKKKKMLEGGGGGGDLSHSYILEDHVRTNIGSALKLRPTNYKTCSCSKTQLI